MNDYLRPILAAPAYLSALGAALSFYLPPGQSLFALALGFLCLSVGEAMGDFPGSGRLSAPAEGPQPESPRGGVCRAWLRPLRALGFGLAFGGLISIGCASFPDGVPNRKSLPEFGSSGAPKPSVRIGRELSFLADGGSTGLPGGITIVGFEGRALGDARAGRGFRVCEVEVDLLRFSGPAMAGELRALRRTGLGRLSFFARSCPPTLAGDEIRARGGFSQGRSGSMFYAADADFRVCPSRHPLRKARAFLLKAFLSSLARVASPEAEGFVHALLSGVKDGLSDEDARAFKNAGCSHVLALSGQHLAILAAAIQIVVKRIAGIRPARWFSLLAAGLFVFTVGPGPSLLRSLLMLYLGAASEMLARPQSGRNLLGLSFLLQLVLDPLSARQPGFILSYLAVWGLVVLTPRFGFFLRTCLPESLAASLSASLGAQTAVSPYLAFAFLSFQPQGVPATLASAILVTALMYWCLAAAAFAAFVPAAAPLLAPVTGGLYAALSGVMDMFSRMPVISLRDGREAWPVVLAVVALGAFVYALPYVQYRSFRRRLGLSPASAFDSGGRMPKP